VYKNFNSEGVEDFTEAAEVEAPLSAATETRRRKRKARSTTTPAPSLNSREPVKIFSAFFASIIVEKHKSSFLM